MLASPIHVRYWSSLIDLSFVDVSNILNDLDVKVLSTREDASLIGVGVGKYNFHETLANININPTDVTDIANNLTVKVLSE